MSIFICLLDKLLSPLAIYNVGQLPRVSREDPERIRVDSVFETLDCLFVLCLLANLVTFCTIKYYSAVQYSMVT